LIFPILTLIVFLPLVGAGLILFIKERFVKIVALATTGVTLLLTLSLLFGFDLSSSSMQFVEKYTWIKGLGISYYLGIDGISLLMIVLGTLLCFVACIASWNVENRVRGYFLLFLLLETTVLGVFCALDFILFYFFWELVLLPMYFLIGIWGGERREYAAIKFVIYTFAGSVFMLLAMLAIYFKSGLHTFDMIALAKAGLPLAFQKFAFWGIFLGLAVKVPIFPFHTWLPDAHVEAPTPVSMLLAGILLKMGTYGFIRLIIPLVPDATYAYRVVLGALGVVSIIYGALCAMSQSDFKRMVAYSSVSHMGYVILGIASLTVIGVNGAVIQMVSHGLISAMFFYMVGDLLYNRLHTRMISEMGGLYTKIPVLAGILAFIAFANLGLPGLSGFIGEILPLLGGFQTLTVLAAIAVPAAIITVGYHLWTLQRVNMGSAPEHYGTIPDIKWRELAVLVPLGIFVIAIGIYPNIALSWCSQTVAKLTGII